MSTSTCAWASHRATDLHEPARPTHIMGEHGAHHPSAKPASEPCVPSRFSHGPVPLQGPAQHRRSLTHVCPTISGCAERRVALCQSDKDIAPARRLLRRRPHRCRHRRPLTSRHLRFHCFSSAALNVSACAVVVACTTRAIAATTSRAIGIATSTTARATSRGAPAHADS